MRDVDVQLKPSVSLTEQLSLGSSRVQISPHFFAA